MRPIYCVLVLGIMGCSESPVVPEGIASVTLTSPIGQRLAVGRTVQLVATARAASGAELPAVAFTWSSSASGTVQVNSAGVASGLAAGNAIVSAQAQGASGSFALRVLAADLDAVSAVLSDPLTAALAGGLTSAVRARAQLALAECALGVTAGNFTTIEACLASARVEVSNATDPTDRALLATLSLLFDHSERRLGI
jgi:hypothetical protein